MRHEPKPEIENHYHIQELIDRQQKRSDDRTYHQNRAKQADELSNDINSAPDIEEKIFYCSKCKGDFFARAHKFIDSWSLGACYKSKCRTCGTWSMRLITDRIKDSYFFRSKVLANQRGIYYNDTIQPFQTGYNTLYGKPK
jgi:hypothetical protein